MSTAVAYLRKSKVSSARGVSWEVQESQVRELAARHGDHELLLLSDWGRSGRGEKTHQRQGYAELKRMVADGAVSTVYSYSLSRLARSLSEYHALAELCAERGVSIRLCKEGEHDYTTPSGKLVIGILAAVAQMEADLAQERARDTVALRRSRGDYIGRPAYGQKLDNGRVIADPTQPVEPVLRAYRETGSFHAAARMLNASVLLPPQGGRWTDTTVRRVMMREAPDDLRSALSATRRGSKGGGGHKLLSGLLRCPCGTTLTPAMQRHSEYGPYYAYICWRARHDPNHPAKKKISERKLLPWVRDEADRLVDPDDYYREGNAFDDSVERRGLEAIRTAIGEDAYVLAVANLDAKRAEQGERERIALDVPCGVDWQRWDTESINRALRSLWECVELGADLMPVRAQWRYPEWRRPDAQP